MSTSWLNRQKKATLIELSEEAGLQQEEESRKEHLVDTLDTYLKQNSTRLSRNPTFEPYYGALTRSRTPGPKRDSSVGHALSSENDVTSVVRGRGRRSTKVKEEHEEDAYTSPAEAISRAPTRRTPGRPRKVVSQDTTDDIPASPAVVADAIEHSTASMYAGLNDFWTVSGIPDLLITIRETCSSVVGVQATCLLLESYGIQSEVLPWKYTGIDIPALAVIGTPEIAIKLPDLFTLLTPYFWSATTLWLSTSLLFPLLFAWFYNLTYRERTRHGVTIQTIRYSADPLTFNIMKTLITWLVYSQGVRCFGFIDDFAVARVDSAIPGGYNGVMIGGFIGILASMYDAAQNRK